MIRPITPAAALAILGLFLASPLQGQTSAPAAGPSAAPHWAFEPLRNVTPPSVPGAKTPVDAFFESVMVNAEDPALRANRLALLGQLHAAMNRVADLARLAS